MTVQGAVKIEIPAAAGTSRILARARREWADSIAPFVAEPLEKAKSVLSVPTWVGWSAIALAALALWSARQWHWLEMGVVAAAVIAVLAFAAPFLVGRIDHRARVDLTRSRVVVGERAVGAVEVVNPTNRTLLSVGVELRVGAAIASFDVPRLVAEAVHEELFTIPTQRRTVLSVGPLRAHRGDPLGIYARQTTWAQAIELFVHPRTVALDGSSSGFLQDLEGLPTRDLSSSDVSFHALREYVAGDDRRHVHWKSSARIGKLMVRQFEETRRSHLAVVLSASGDEYGHPDHFELAVSCAGSLSLQAIREEKQVSVLWQGGAIPTRTGKMLLDGLSGIDVTARRRGSVVDVCLASAMAVPAASVAVIVTGSRATPSDLRKAAARLPAGVHTVALVCEEGVALSRHTIGDMVVLTIGELGDLPAAMRKALM